MPGATAQDPQKHPLWMPPADARDGDVIVHASCVGFERAAALLIGPSGVGKSTLALQMMGYGSSLVSDDQTKLRRDAGGHLLAQAPETVSGMIEARGFGLLGAKPLGQARVTLIVDLTKTETDRLPPRRVMQVLGKPVRCVHKIAPDAFAAAIVQYLKGGEVPT